MSKKSTTEEFIVNAREMYGSKYDYSKVVYVNRKVKVIIVCKEHGEFQQFPYHHLHGIGCSKCAGVYKPTTEEFIYKAKQIHGNKYDYSLVSYINNKTKINIICSEHGEFQQIPNSHIIGKGCPKCKNKSKRLTNESFKNKAIKIHGDKFKYGDIEHKNGRSKITIICPKHGKFIQPLSGHLRGYGCPKCSGNIKLTICEFIHKAEQVHGSKYKYNESEYENSKTKIKIICPEHGEFSQTPNSHLCGQGCPKCSGLISTKQLEFLEYCGLTNDDCEIKFGKYNVDGYKNGIIYEFLGDYWHGNPRVYNPYEINHNSGKMFGQLNMITFNRFNKLKLMTNHTIKYIWEMDWNDYKNGLVDKPKIQVFK